MISKETGIKQTLRNLHFGFSTLGEAISKSLIRVLVLNMSLKLRIRLWGHKFSLRVIHSKNNDSANLANYFGCICSSTRSLSSQTTASLSFIGFLLVSSTSSLLLLHIWALTHLKFIEYTSKLRQAQLRMKQKQIELATDEFQFPLIGRGFIFRFLRF